MENQVNSKKIILNYGAYLGIASVLISLVVYAMGMAVDRPWQQGIVSFLIMVVILVLGINQFKKENGGFVSWGQAVKVGVGISVISALISIVYNQVFINFIEPDFMTQLYEFEKQKWVDQGLLEEQIESATKIFEMMSGPVISSAVGIIAGALFGFIISAIAGAVMKKSAEDLY